MAKKKPTKKKPAKKTVKKVAKKKVVKKKRKANPALMKPVTPSAALAAVVGAKPAPRGQMTKRLWDYIKKNKLQDKVKKTMIHADDKLKVIFNGNDPIRYSGWRMKYR